MTIYRFCSSLFLPMLITLIIVLWLALSFTKLTAVQKSPTANIIVDSTLDLINNSDGVCTLREALMAANEDVAFGTLAGECVAGSEQDIITFDLPADAIITLDGFPLTISKTVTMIGRGADQLTIDANQRNRILQIKPTAIVTISGMTLSGGKNPADLVNAAGILNEQGTLLLDDVIVQNNVLTAGDGGGIHSLDGSLTLLNSVVQANTAAGDGGGIFSRATAVTISNTIIADNHATDEGGGIHINDTAIYPVTIIDSEIKENTALNKGGGVSLVRTSHALLSRSNWLLPKSEAGGALILRTTIWGNQAKQGGGIANNGMVKVRATTLSSNTAGQGGGIFSVGIDNKLMISNTTIYQNTGGLYSESNPPYAHNTIIAHDDTIGDDCNEALVKSNYVNLDSDASCGVTLTGDPRLAPLVDGIHLLYGDSPAWDAGGKTVCADQYDQRHMLRPSGFACDLGAFERNTPLQHIFLPIGLSFLESNFR